MTTLSEIKNIIRPTLYWKLRRLSRQLYFLKQKVRKEFNKSRILKFFIRFI